ncbi:serine hydrolase domain-containing protein [Nonomuraea gerenzanensis]|uniref:D-alanyl-D-alanine carboxypeptidase n=1 Tax=Nonomuraea gerenzanensis TaxID=93944 RepID=A0A1M4DVW7_9ACTN|nr:serine hydrolase domain-containing protein [Nonomuraea gerenzanensis]UBU13051.1 beta-lactamase family protein [Nonomuraea gerenzanensis]SBO90693.1 D-alanyl-D-alanine carboxypeptidase [Nonomuraea gerenzanensis]
MVDVPSDLEEITLLKTAAACLALATALVAAPAQAATSATLTCPAPTVMRPDPGAVVPPVDQAALSKSIAGLPAADATAAVVRVSGSKGSWRGVSGVADVRTGREAAQHVRFRVGSVTKVFTTAVVLQLVAEGRLSLGDTVQDHLPGLLPASYPDVQVGQLLNHTSGLPAPELPEGFEHVYETRFDRWTPQQYVALAVRNPIEFTPGTRQHYLNINTFVAGLLIEQVTGETYEHEVTNRILRPVGMRDSYLPGTSTTIRGPHHRGYQSVPAGFANAIPYGDGYVVDMTRTSVTSTWASGDLISTAADLEKFVKALFSGEVVPPAQLEPMFTVPDVTMFDECGNQPATYTSGLTKMVLPDGIVAYGKTGSRYGYTTGVGATRDLSRTLVYSVNSTDAKSSGQNRRTLGIVLASFA